PSTRRRRGTGEPEARGPARNSHEIVRHEAAVVVGDAPFVLAHADAGGLALDHPGADQSVIAVEHRQRLVGLPDEALAAVVATGGIEHARSNDGDVVAFAAEDRLLDERAAEIGMLAVE